MSPGAGDQATEAARGPQGRPEDLLPLALSRPADAFSAATELLADSPDLATASVAHQARAIVLRDSGRSAEAIAELRLAVRLARRSRDSSRVADVQATLGLTLGLAGHGAQGLAALDRAMARSKGTETGRILTRRGYLLRVLGRYDEALRVLRRAIAILRRARDPVWEARARSHRFVVYAALGQASHADRDLVIAEQLCASAGQELESAMAVHNRADVAFQRGDIPAALGFLDEAESRYAALGTFWPSLAVDRCAVLLAAGLATEALDRTEEVLKRHAGDGRTGTEMADLFFAVAQAALAGGRPSSADEYAAKASELFRQQGRTSLCARASFIRLRARHELGEQDGSMAVEADRLAEQLDGLKAWEAPAAHLLAGQLAAAEGRTAQADHHLARAARFRHRGPTFGHAAGWLAQALHAEGRGATGAVLAACRQGLRAASDHQRSLAAPELRAHASAYGAELAALAQRHAVRRHDARMLLRWSERWKASALAAGPVKPPDDPELAADLAALRHVVRSLDAVPAIDANTDRLNLERIRLEAAIRARTRRLRAEQHSGPAERQRADDHRSTDEVARLVDGLAGHTLVELTALDGELFAVTVVGRRVRMHAIGPLASAVREVDLAQFMLRRLAYGRPPPAALDAVRAAGLRLQQVLLGPAAADLHGGPVVVVPPASLHAVPWAMLPALTDTPFVIAPSASIWLRAGLLQVPRDRRVAVVIGPGLESAAAELAQIAERYPGAVLLGQGNATAKATLSALDGAWTAHIAAHGIFRADNPLFSAVDLDDGPLTIYDLGRLHRAPRRIVLSSCESGRAVPVAGDELLGMVSALVPLGTASVLASVVPVNDAATAQLMVDFHDRLTTGLSFGTALQEVRCSLEGDPVLVATALSFIALGR